MRSNSFQCFIGFPFEHGSLYRDGVEIKRACSIRIDIQRLSTESMRVPEASSSIHFFSIVKLHDKHDKFFFLKHVDGPVAAFPDTVNIVLSGEFPNALWARIVLQGF